MSNLLRLVCVRAVQCAVFVYDVRCVVYCVRQAVCVEFPVASVLCCGIRRGVASAPRGGTKTPHLLMLLRTTMMMTMFMMVRMRLYDRYEDETGKRKFE